LQPLKGVYARGRDDMADKAIGGTSFLVAEKKFSLNWFDISGIRKTFRGKKP